MVIWALMLHLYVCNLHLQIQLGAKMSSTNFDIRPYHRPYNFAYLSGTFPFGSILQVQYTVGET